MRLAPLFCSILFLGILSLSCSEQRVKTDSLPYSWAAENFKNDYAYWHIADSVSLRRDTIYGAMTVELRNSLMLTTTRLQGAQIIKSELLRRTAQGLMRLLPCDDGSRLEQVFLPFPIQQDSSRKDASALPSWAITACTGDTTSTFRIQSADTSITVPAGTFRVVQLREVDFTNLTTDFYFHETAGLVQMTIQHSLINANGTRYLADATAKPFEGFILVKAGKRRK